MYHGNAQRTANDTSEPALLPAHRAWQRPLDAAVYAQPLVFNGRVFTATENNTVYALDAHDGGVLWSRHLGPPMRNVSAQVGWNVSGVIAASACGDRPDRFDGMHESSFHACQIVVSHVPC